jgi:hypothetical protein
MKRKQIGRTLSAWTACLLMTQVACPARNRVEDHPVPASALSLRERLTPGREIDSISRIHHSHESGLYDNTRLVVRDQGTWRAIWSRIQYRDRTREPQSPPLVEPPVVDFWKEMVVIAAGGHAGCPHDVVLDSLYIDGLGQPVVVVNTWEALSCGCLQGEQPVDVIRLPVSRAIRFLERPVRDVCGASPHSRGQAGATLR